MVETMQIFIRLLAIGAIIIVAGLFAAKQFDSGQQAVLGDTAKAQPAEPTYSLDEASLNSSVQSVLDANPRLNLSVSVTDLQTGKSYHYGDPEAYTAASVAKLFTATLFLHETETGKTSLSQQVGAQTAGKQLEKLIVDSDNAAWHALNDTLTHQTLEEYAASIGVASYDSNANTVSSSDIALLLSKLAAGKLLNNANTTLLLSYMERASMRDYLVAGVPSGATTYHKTGYLSDRFHDAAIVKKGDRSFVVVVFSKTNGSYDFSKGASVFSGLSASVSSAFFGAP